MSHSCPQHGDAGVYVRTVQFTSKSTGAVWFRAFYECPTGGHEYDVDVEWEAAK